MDDATGPADDVSAHGRGYVAGTLLIEVSTRGNEGTGRENDVHMSGNVVGEGADDVSVERGAIGVRKLLSESRWTLG